MRLNENRYEDLDRAVERELNAECIWQCKICKGTRDQTPDTPCFPESTLPMQLPVCNLCGAILRPVWRDTLTPTYPYWYEERNEE